MSSPPVLLVGKSIVVAMVYPRPECHNFGSERNEQRSTIVLASVANERRGKPTRSLVAVWRARWQHEAGLAIRVTSVEPACQLTETVDASA